MAIKNVVTDGLFEPPSYLLTQGLGDFTAAAAAAGTPLRSMRRSRARSLPAILGVLSLVLLL